MATRIIRADTSHLDLLVPLLHDYRVFYEQAGDRSAERQFLKARLEHEESVIFIAIDPDSSPRAQGFVQLFPSFDSVEMIRIWILHDLFVDRRARRKGVGRMLMAAAEALARESGAGRLDLATALTNRAAQSLYDSMGYQRDDEFHHYSLELES